MTIRVTNAPNEEDAEKAIKNQYQGFDSVFLKKVKKDKSEDYIYFFDIADTSIEYRGEER